jgi:hypothetical protein
MDWTDEYNQIVCELMAQQVKKEKEEEVQAVSPSVANKKRKAHVVLKILKKPKSSTALVIQEQITKIVESASSFA